VDLADLVLGLAGGEEMNAYSRFAENIRKAKQDGDENAILACDEWDAIDKQLGQGSYKKAPDPNAKGKKE
jgi:hypothetical protein